MPSLLPTLSVLLLTALPGLSSGTNLDPNKFHCVSYNAASQTGVFRSNMPVSVNSTNIATPSAYAYSEIKSYAGTQGKEECGTSAFTKPDVEPYVLELSLSNSLDDKNGLLASRAFWSQTENYASGRVAEWPIGLAGLVPPKDVPKFKWKSIVNNMWEVDQLPSRVDSIQEITKLGYAGLFPDSVVKNRPLIVLIHCNAGCDRTGEMIGAYRYTTTNLSPKEMYALDVQECGRAPNYYSTHALEWYCIWEFYNSGKGEKLEDCIGFAECEPFGDCEPIE
ncbi:hypothetical protein TrLO_g8938 [Triparma laevis f. longispina]|uniref:Tyrosine specific protein phosphatases domain-containing protein n=1 Tax=Triparma laevis f. longispina TaxID=1714387 RepID=A0A9W7L0B1_9STRA|nr:hypothetical protein TrLO_g8938 [Triparma laevis f. longispina]